MPKTLRHRSSPHLVPETPQSSLSAGACLLVALALAAATSTRGGAQPTGSLSSIESSSESATVSLTSPNGGQKLLSGGVQTATWTIESASRAQRVLLDLSLNGGKRWTRIADVQMLSGESDSPTSQVWPVPTVAKIKRRCLLRVTLKDKKGRRVGRDSSDRFFTIKPNTDASSSKGIGPAGGAISVTDSRGNVVTLTIPIGALNERTIVSLTTLKQSPTSYVAANVFKGVVIEPHGLVLNEPARLEVLFAKKLTNPALSRLFWLHSEDVALAIAEQTEKKKRMSGEILHFSTYPATRIGSQEKLWRWAEKMGSFDILYGLFPWLDTWLDTHDASHHLFEMAKAAEELGNFRDAADYRDGAMGALEEGALKFLSMDIPAGPCGHYRSFVHSFRSMASKLGDPEIDQWFSERAIKLDEKACLLDLSGNWKIVPVAGSQTCWSGDASWVEDEGSPESWRLHIAQQDLEIRATFPELPSAIPLEGELVATGDQKEPYTYNLDVSSSQTPDCMFFFDTEGGDTVFGQQFCNRPGVRCVPKTCHENEINDGTVSEFGNRAEIHSDWEIRVTYDVVDEQGDSSSEAVTCIGEMDSSASRPCEGAGSKSFTRRDSGGGLCEELDGALKVCSSPASTAEELESLCRSYPGSYNQDDWPLTGWRLKKPTEPCTGGLVGGRLFCTYCFLCV